MTEEDAVEIQIKLEEEFQDMAQALMAEHVEELGKIPYGDPARYIISVIGSLAGTMIFNMVEATILASEGKVNRDVLETKIYSALTDRYNFVYNAIHHEKLRREAAEKE